MSTVSMERQLVAELRIVTKNSKFRNKDLISWSGKIENLRHMKKGSMVVNLSRFGVYCLISENAKIKSDMKRFRYSLMKALEIQEKENLK
jgi:hypothetical protein